MLGDYYNNRKEAISTAEDLAVKLCVRRASLNRPKFWPGTQISYPLYESRGQECKHLGSGRVCNVTKYTDGKSEKFPKHKAKKERCYCSLCRSSQTPNRVWWEIDIITAAQIVFDESEVEHTSCTLFNESFETEIDLNIDKIAYACVRLDLCKLTCVTCNADLGTELTMLVKSYDSAWKQMNTANVETQVLLMVSFPDGNEKSVEYGILNDDLEKSFTFKRDIGHGSIGATVHLFGCQNNYLILSTVQNERGVSCIGSKGINLQRFDKKREYFLHESLTADNGDRIEILRKKYVLAHWGISEGNNEIIHLWADGPGSFIKFMRMLTWDRDFKIRKDKLYRVQKEDECIVNNSLDNIYRPFDREVISQIARSELEHDNEGYNIFFKNCEQFVNKCRYGYKTYAFWCSQQVLRFWFYFSIILSIILSIIMYIYGEQPRDIGFRIFSTILPSFNIYSNLLHYFAFLNRIKHHLHQYFI